MTTSQGIKSEIEFDVSGWDRFEQAVDAAVKSGPKHKITKRAKLAEQVKDTKNANDERDSGDNRGGNRSD